jgi:hypothetical protein
MAESMATLNRRIEVIVKIMYVHIAIAEAAAWSDVEVSYDFIHLEPTFNTTSFPALGIKLFAIVFSFALLYILSSTKRPSCRRIRFSDLETSELRGAIG